MVSFPNAKINLGLRILRKRNDQYHDLDTIFYPLPFTDVLEIIRAPAGTDTTFSTSGLAIDGDLSSNLCIKAYQLLAKDFPQLPPVQMHLHKLIPTGAGLGGGSADAAFTLQLLNRIFLLGLAQEDLLQYSLQLGSDCPFFIINKPCHARGRGEIMEKVPLTLSQYKLVLVNPGIHVSTAQAFGMLSPAVPGASTSDTIQKPVDQWKGELLNDFEQPVFQQYPEIGSIRDELYKSGAVYASMSGSGSTVFGLFEKTSSAGLRWPAHYFVKELTGLL